MTHPSCRHLWPKQKTKGQRRRLLRQRGCCLCLTVKTKRKRKQKKTCPLAAFSHSLSALRVIIPYIFISTFSQHICPVILALLPLTFSSPLTFLFTSFQPSSSKKDGVCSQTSLNTRDTQLDTDAEEEIRISQSPAGDTLVKQRQLSAMESGRGRGGWSWTVGDNCYTAQWVKQKQEYRSTRPWWLRAGSGLWLNSTGEKKSWSCGESSNSKTSLEGPVSATHSQALWFPVVEIVRSALAGLQDESTNHPN